jgi:hypothetical protein
MSNKLCAIVFMIVGVSTFASDEPSKKMGIVGEMVTPGGLIEGNNGLPALREGMVNYKALLEKLEARKNRVNLGAGCLAGLLVGRGSFKPIGRVLSHVQCFSGVAARFVPPVLAGFGAVAVFMATMVAGTVLLGKLGIPLYIPFSFGIRRGLNEIRQELYKAINKPLIGQNDINSARDTLQRDNESRQNSFVHKRQSKLLDDLSRYVQKKR